MLCRGGYLYQNILYMKKKNLTTRLALKKITITSLSDSDATLVNGGISTAGCASVAEPCIPPTERRGCSNDCPVVSEVICPATKGCPTSAGCPTWAPQSCPQTCIG